MLLETYQVLQDQQQVTLQQQLLLQTLEQLQDNHLMVQVILQLRQLIYQTQVLLHY